MAVAGVPSNPNLFYMGGVEGGIWKSTNYGLSWENISDGKLPGVASPIGALAVAPSNPNVIYAGTGEADIRGDFDTGDGVYKTTERRKDVVVCRAARHAHDHEDRRRSAATPTWRMPPRWDTSLSPTPSAASSRRPTAARRGRRSLYVDQNTGGVDLVMDSRNRNVLYAAMWQAQRQPWKLTNGGPGSALYKTTDGGAHWTKISTNRGFATGTLGKIGVSVAASNPRIVYAIVQAGDGGVFRSNDAGRYVEARQLRDGSCASAPSITRRSSSIRRIRRSRIAPEVDAVYRTKDGGKTWTEIDPPHGDNHIVWINPRNPKIFSR